MEQYERTIGLKTIYLTLVRRFIYILLIFIPIALGTFIVTNFVMPKKYQSSVTFTKTSGTINSSSDYPSLKVAILDSDVLNTVSGNLATNNVLHKNGKEITASEIQNGITFNSIASSGATSFTFNFQSSDSSIVQPVLTEYSNVVFNLHAVNTDVNSPTYKISSAASPAANITGAQKYTLIGLSAGFVLACGVPFVYEIIADEVYDAEDVRWLGSDAFELRTSK